MVSTPFKPTQKAWAKAIARPGEEFALTPLSIVSGAIPAGLQGTLYRNGPGRLDRGGKHVGHWFDGDGAILGVHFRSTGASAVYRYVQTSGYLAEAQQDRFLSANYGMTDPQGVWNFWWRVLSKQDSLKNAANTSVLALPDKLLALWEAGQPHSLDLETLETKGVETLGSLQPTQPYSAHPLRDPLTGEIFSIGVDIQGNLHIYKSDRTGQIKQQTVIKLNDLPFIHSFALAGQYLIFFLPPLKMDKMAVLLGTKSYADSLEWHPASRTQILVVDRETFDVVSRGETEPWFQWHYGNACVEADGLVRLDFVRFTDFSQTNEYLREVATGTTTTVANGNLWEVRLDPKTAKIVSMQEVLDRSSEFPVVSPQSIGRSWRHTYLALQRKSAGDSEFFGAIGCFDYETGTLTEADLGENMYTVEPLYIPDALNPDRGWIMTVVYDGNNDRSEVWIFDFDRLTEAPICRLALPGVIPFSFHGTWRAV
ncbi:carotenoid oxygenase family protein [Chamaesiphon sp. VAR_48_metabat_135_sub]|uniref:carotenoid oxygenase family protein n=1 Tax=Chamaesiphon sp. VAR_48_metabat_135_sub TaxID=2964699 RepID=UPI002869FD0F|nr:carotenoid oxygenase family protein [Chamaesiphon sp. VAR_48_metabat_135_sub]